MVDTDNSNNIPAQCTGKGNGDGEVDGNKFVPIQDIKEGFLKRSGIN